MKAPLSALSFVGWAAFGALVVLAVISLPFLWIAALLALCLLAFSGSTGPAPSASHSGQALSP